MLFTDDLLKYSNKHILAINEHDFANTYYETIYLLESDRFSFLNVEQNGNRSTTKLWTSQIDVLFLYSKTKPGFMKRFSKQEVYKIVSNIHQ